jgi:hypothetical protein
LIFPCKDYPDHKGNADWCAALKVRISNPAKHSPPSRPFEALIDTGASRCIFHAQIGRALGFNIEKGEEEKTMGVDGKLTMLYLHTVSIYAMGGIYPVVAGFSDELPLSGLLGRRGFLDRFKFCYDSSSVPPQFELSLIVRL